MTRISRIASSIISMVAAAAVMTGVAAQDRVPPEIAWSTCRLAVSAGGGRAVVFPTFEAPWVWRLRGKEFDAEPSALKDVSGLASLGDRTVFACGRSAAGTGVLAVFTVDASTGVREEHSIDLGPILPWGLALDTTTRTLAMFDARRQRLVCSRLDRDDRPLPKWNLLATWKALGIDSRSDASTLYLRAHDDGGFLVSYTHEIGGLYAPLHITRSEEGQVTIRRRAPRLMRAPARLHHDRPLALGHTFTLRAPRQGEVWLENEGRSTRIRLGTVEDAARAVELRMPGPSDIDAAEPHRLALEGSETIHGEWFVPCLQHGETAAPGNVSVTSLSMRPVHIGDRIHVAHVGVDPKVSGEGAILCWSRVDGSDLKHLIHRGGLAFLQPSTVFSMPCSWTSGRKRTLGVPVVLPDDPSLQGQVLWLQVGAAGPGENDVALSHVLGIRIEPSDATSKPPAAVLASARRLLDRAASQNPAAAVEFFDRVVKARSR